MDKWAVAGGRYPVAEEDTECLGLYSFASGVSL